MVILAKPTSEVTKVGIIGGNGFSGRNMHLKVLLEMAGVEVVALYDVAPITRVKDGMTTVPESVALYDNLDQFLAHDGLEVVHVATPSGYHADGIIAAARAGKHVISDKPLEVTLAKAERVIWNCTDAGVQLALNMQQRYGDNAPKLRRLIVDQNGLGNIGCGKVENHLYRPDAYYAEPTWHGKLAIDGGGAQMNQGIHSIDLLLWLLGNPQIKSVVSGVRERRVHKKIEAEDYAMGDLLLANGAQLVMETGTCYENPDDRCERITIYGSAGVVVLDQGLITKATANNMDLLEAGYFGEQVAKQTQTGGKEIDLTNHKRLFEATYAALKAGQDVPVPGREGLHALKAILMAYHASEPGKGEFTPAYAPGPF